MNRFKNILVVVDANGDPVKNYAVVRGAELAKQNGATLTLFDVVPSPKTTISKYKGILKADEITKMLVDERMAVLGKVADELGTDIDVSCKVVIGKDAIETIRQVVLNKHDLLIKVANESANGFDSSDFSLMRKCPQPVWLCKGNLDNDTKGHKANRVLAAVDLELEESEEGKALNKLILDLATSLSSEDGGELHLLSCWSLYGEKSLRSSAFLKVSDSELTQILEEEEQANRSVQTKLTEQYSGHNIQTHLIKGNPVEHIPKVAQENSIDLVVMGTVGRSGIPGFLIGNTAETILRSLNASVITVKPGGFESPIA